jgi:predicted Zn-dependent protease
MLLPLSMLPAHRQHEFGADEAAVRAMAAAGYDPRALLEYISRMPPDAYPANSPLPPKSERLENLTAAIESTALPKLRAPSGAFTTIQQQIRTKQAALNPPEPPHPVPSLLHPAK